MRHRITRALGVDFRALGLLRMALALVLIAYLFLQLTQFRLYTDAGPFPRALVLRAAQAPKVVPCLHLMLGRYSFQAILFAAHLAAAFALLVGYRTRLAALLCWFLTLSLQTRLPFSSNPGEQLVAVLLFWGLFVPWDPRSDGEQESDEPVLSAASVALTLQLCLICWMSSLSGQHPVVVWTLRLGPILLLAPWAGSRLAGLLLLVVAVVGSSAPWLWKAALLAGLMGLLPSRVWGPQVESARQDVAPLTSWGSLAVWGALLLVLWTNLWGGAPRTPLLLTGLEQQWRQLDSPLARARYSVVARLETGRVVDLTRLTPNLGRLVNADERSRLLALMARRWHARRPNSPLNSLEVVAEVDDGQLSLGRWVKGVDPPATNL